VLPIKVDTDKLSRAEAVTPLFEAGKVFVPEAAPWLADYLDEMTSFASGPNDDVVDSSSMALNYLRQKRGDYMRVVTVGATAPLGDGNDVIFGWGKS